MKTSLDHLPADKQEQILQIVAMIKEVAKPEKIILFGSHARDNYVAHKYFGRDGTRYDFFSDYDFLVVTKKNSMQTYEIENQIEDKWHSRKIPINIELHEIDYINEGLSFGQYFFTEIIEDGILLHDTGNFDFAKPRILTPEEQRAIAQRYYNIWFSKGEGFLKVANYCLKEGDYKIGVFNLHQAAECFFIVILLVFTGYKPKTHNLWKLRRRTKAYSAELFLVFETEINKNDNHLFDLLKRGYIDARYKTEFSISGKELEELIEKVKQLKEIVQDISMKKIESLK